MSKTCEKWLPISGYPEYSVSSQGRVRRDVAARGTSAGKILKPYIQPNGYLKVTLSVGSVRCKRYVHRLVLEAFCGSPPFGKTDCAHGNGDRSDNRLLNLRWATRSENVADTERHGTKAKGERNGHAILTEGDVRRMRKLRADGCTQDYLAQAFGVHRWTVADACSGKNWGWLQ